MYLYDVALTHLEKKREERERERGGEAYMK